MTTEPAFVDFQHIAPEWRLYCGENSLLALGKELRRNGCERAVVVCGRSVGASSALELLRAALGPVLVGESHAVQPNSPVPAVQAVVGALQQHRADAVIAIGGGSAAVTARAAAILLAEQRPAQALCTRRLANGSFQSPRLDAPKLAQFVLPTTPSTAFVKAGSAVHDTATGERLALFDPKTRAKAVFLHPAFLRTAPLGLVQEACLNTLSTAVEALESPQCDPVSEAMLTQALRLVARHLEHMAPEDIGARAHLAIAALLCGRGTEQAGGGLASVLAHAIGHRVQVANGIVNAIVLPHTLRFNAPATEARSARIVTSLGQAPSAVPADVLQALLAPLPIARRLRDIGLRREDFDAVANAALADFFIHRSPRRVQGAADLLGILDAAW